MPIIEVVLEAGSGCGAGDGAWCATIEAAEAAVGGGCCFKRRNSSSTCLPSSVGRRAAA